MDFVFLNAATASLPRNETEPSFLALARYRNHAVSGFFWRTQKPETAIGPPSFEPHRSGFTLSSNMVRARPTLLPLDAEAARLRGDRGCSRRPPGASAVLIFRRGETPSRRAIPSAARRRGRPARREALGEDARRTRRRRLTVRARSSRRHPPAEVASAPVVLRRPWREKPRDSRPQETRQRFARPRAGARRGLDRPRASSAVSRAAVTPKAPPPRSTAAAASRRRRAAAATPRVVHPRFLGFIATRLFSSFAIFRRRRLTDRAIPPLFPSPSSLFLFRRRGSTSRLVGATRSSTARRPSPRTCTCASS